MRGLDEDMGTGHPESDAMERNLVLGINPALLRERIQQYLKKSGIELNNFPCTPGEVGLEDSLFQLAPTDVVNEPFARMILEKFQGNNSWQSFRLSELFSDFNLPALESFLRALERGNMIEIEGYFSPDCLIHPMPGLVEARGQLAA